VRRIVYLGGLGDEKQPLSAHLQSRHEVGEVLRASGVPIIEFRASIIIGSGSLSFELIRALVERLPAMITPRWWMSSHSQSLSWMCWLSRVGSGSAGGRAPAPSKSAGPIACPTEASCASMPASEACGVGMISVPVLTPKLSSLWLGLVTPLYARIGRILIDSIRHETVGSG